MRLLTIPHLKRATDEIDFSKVRLPEEQLTLLQDAIAMADKMNETSHYNSPERQMYAKLQKLEKETMENNMLSSIFGKIETSPKNTLLEEDKTIFSDAAENLKPLLDSINLSRTVAATVLAYFHKIKNQIN